MNRILREFWRHKQGATSVEYALIMVIVGVGVIVSLQTMGTALTDIFTGIADHVESVN